ncbi:MAG: hypothetical protein V4669_15345 [Pseudomonadota bacterium]
MSIDQRISTDERRAGYSRPWPAVAIMSLALAGSTLSLAQPVPAESRGQLLYSTHCIACHTAQMHWRNNRAAYDWQSLNVQVRLWQRNAGLQWSDADVVEVSRYLNSAIYKFPQPDDRVISKSSIAASSP